MLVTALLALTLASAEPTMACQLTCTPIKKECVCPPPKPVKKKVVKKVRKTAIVQKQEQSQQVIVTIQASEPRLVKPEPAKPIFGVGVRGAVGLMACDPYVFPLIGVRARLFPAHLGLEVNTQLLWGSSAQLLVYPVQGPIAWHLDFGALLFERSGPQVNLLAGTGVEVQVVPHLSLTADWRMTMPKPFNVGTSLLRSQLMFGLLLHTW
jgi:hypothetical protein